MKKIIFLLTIISTLSFGKVQVEEICKEGYKLNISNEYIDVNNIKFDSLDFDLQKYKYDIFQDLPIQLTSYNNHTYIVRIKDIKSICINKDTFLVNIIGSAFRQYGIIEIQIEDKQLQKMLLDMMEFQKQYILKNLK